MKFIQYESFEKHSHVYTVCGIASLPDRKRFKFYHCIMQTFAMLRLHPRFKAFLEQLNARRTIATEARRWITEDWYNGRCLPTETPFVKQLLELQMPAAFGDDHHFVYLIENISCRGGIIMDVADTLESIMRQSSLFCPSCIPETAAECCSRKKLVDDKERLQWLTAVSAPAVARNAFDLGWELRMLSTVRDFEAEVAHRDATARGHAMMRVYLKSVEANILELQQEEEDVNVAAAVALQRAGLVTEVCRMIMPGKTRYMGFPLAVMPPYLKLD